MSISDLIHPRHLTRRAVIYVRQSTPQQVITHQESHRMQYALRQRAVELGWSEAKLEVIDADLGRSAATTHGRSGYQSLVAQVALGQVGAVFAYDATRLARNCSHWYQLLDLCGRADCLIADRDGVYDPSSVNGRLLLGLKGQISELELHTIRARLNAGVLSKARRGELAVELPTGLVRSPSGQVVKHPHQEVQSRIELIFRILMEKKALARVVRALRQENLLVPRKDRYGEIQWRQPTASMLGDMVTNPAYAGTFAFGRNTAIRDEESGRVRRKEVAADQWKACVHDVYPAYISWGTFERIRDMLHDNHGEYAHRQSRGIPRDGKALLQGIVYCGECGHKMTVAYKGGARYMCHALYVEAGEPVCQDVYSERIDEQVTQWFFEALSAAEIDLASRTLQQADERRSEMFKAQRQQLERLRHEARLAERQYRHSEPENRLVAAELERRWELALREMKQAEEALAAAEQTTSCWAIPSDLLEALRDIGPRLPDLWNQRLLSWSQKKSLLRCLVDKVVLRRTGDRVHVRVVWRGGDATQEDVPVTVGRFTKLTGAQEMEATIVRMASEGCHDQEIAGHLTAAGYRSPRKPIVIASTVARVRLSHGIRQNRNLGRPRLIPGYLRAHQIATTLGIEPHWIYDRIKNGKIKIAKDPDHRTYLFPDNPETLRQFRQFLDGQIGQLQF